MKSLIKKIYNSSKILKLRNTFGIKKNPIYLGKLKKNFYISDSFLWRTDNGFVTKFAFSDILKYFYQKKCLNFIIKFYDQDSLFLKDLIIDPLESKELIIDNKKSEFKNYGYFQIFSKLRNGSIDENLSNRCYVGYSKNNQNFSFVHGNSYTKAMSLIENENDFQSNLVQTSLTSNQNYYIQNDFKNLDYFELFFINPVNEKISLKIKDKDKVDINPNSVYKIKLKNYDLVSFKSNCCFLRPIVFCYKNGYLDAHHA